MSTTAPAPAALEAFCARYIAAWNDHDAAAADLVTEDVVWEPGFAATGRTIEIEGVDPWGMRDGRIARYRAFYDVNALAVQLGLAPAPGSRMEKGLAALQRLGAKAAARRRPR